MATTIVVHNVKLNETLEQHLNRLFPGDWAYRNFTIGKFVTAIGDLDPDAVKGEFIEVLGPDMSQTSFGVDHALGEADLQGDYTFQIGVYNPDFVDNEEPGEEAELTTAGTGRVVIEKVWLNESLYEVINTQFVGTFGFEIDENRGAVLTHIGELIPGRDEFLKIICPDGTDANFGFGHILTLGDQAGDYTIVIDKIIPIDEVPDSMVDWEPGQEGRQ